MNVRFSSIYHDTLKITLKSHSVKINLLPYICDVVMAVLHNIQGNRLTFFRQEQTGPLKQNDWGPSSKLSCPGFGKKLISFQYHCQAFSSLIIEVRDPQNLYSPNYLPL